MVYTYTQGSEIKHNLTKAPNYKDGHNYTILPNRSGRIEPSTLHEWSDIVLPARNAIKELEKGRSYLLLSGSSHTEDILNKIGKDHSRNALIFTRTRPNIVYEKLKLQHKEANIFWVSMASNSKEKTILPTAVPKINMIIQDYISKEHGKLIFLGGIEYLVLHNGFEPIMKFIQYTIDMVSLSRALMLIPIDPLVFDMKDWRMLRRDMETVSLK